jgi:Tol biopolymer transport system component
VAPGEYVASGKVFKHRKKFYFTSNASGWVRKGKTRTLTLRYLASKTNPQAGPLVLSSPFKNVSPAAGVALVSRTPSGTSGNDASLYPSWAPDASLYFSSCATNLTGDTDICHAYRSAGGVITRIAGAYLGTDILDWGGQTAVSPDGSALGFTTLARLVPGDTDDNKDVYTLNLTSSELTRVSQTPEGFGMAGGEESPNAAEAPTWAPDSARLAFITQSTNLAPKDDYYDDVFVKNLLTGGIGRAGVKRTVHRVSWSPDGGSIAFDGEDEFSDADVEVDSHIYVASAGGSPVQFTNDGQSFDPAWSPDGSRIAFASNSALVAADKNNTTDVYVKDLASGAVTRVSLDSAGKQTGWASSAPVWSRDGSKIAFVAQDGDFGQTVLVKNLATGTLIQVFDPAAVGANPDEDNTVMDLVFSPDGSQLAFDSDYPRITAGDSNNASDVFVATL